LQNLGPLPVSSWYGSWKRNSKRRTGRLLKAAGITRGFLYLYLMDLIIGLIVAVKSLVFMGGYISPDRIPARVSDMQVHVTQHDIRISCVVAHAFTRDLRKLAQSGTPIFLYVFAQVEQVDNDSLMTATVTENRLVYDLSRKKYILKRSNAEDTLSFDNIDSALAAASTFAAMPLLTKEIVVPDKSYYFIIWAVLGKTRVEALENKDIDLMYFWDYKRPTLRTAPFRGTQLLATPEKK
jgi:Domain of unknown function (DUF4390)